MQLPINAKVPSNWVKVNSTKTTIRYHPPEVLTALDQLRLANEELNIICRAAWDSFLREFGEYYVEFQAAVQALSALDCLHSLATLSRNKVSTWWTLRFILDLAKLIFIVFFNGLLQNYVRPIFVDDNEPVQIQIHSGRHPVS